MYTNSFDLTVAYLESMKDRAGYDRAVRVAMQWILQQRTTPTRAQILARHISKGQGDYQPGSEQANKELALQRAAFRWGIYHGVWEGGDPTLGIKRFKKKKRKRIAKFLEVRALLTLFEFSPFDKLLAYRRYLDDGYTKHRAREKADFHCTIDVRQAVTEVRNRAFFGICLLTGCRPSEFRLARLGSITPYGEMGCWKKGPLKNGEDGVEIPVPKQAMQWLTMWLRVRDMHCNAPENPYIFPGYTPRGFLCDDALRKEWRKLRAELGISGLWNYDLRRTLASYLSNELNVPDKKIQAILNHYDGRALSHYCHVSFDALVPIVQQYADWLWQLKPADDAQTTMPFLKQISNSPNLNLVRDAS